jgi:hypothetical protein
VQSSGRILRHWNERDPPPETLSPAGPDPPLPEGETLHLSCHPVGIRLGSRTNLDAMIRSNATEYPVLEKELLIVES